MRGDNLPESDHLSRFVRPSLIEVVDGAPEIQGAAFWSRPIDHNGASYNWLEYWPGSREDQLEAVRKLARLKVAATARLAVLSIGSVMRAIQESFPEHVVGVVHDPLEAEGEHLADESHALMINMPAEGEPLAEAIGDLIANFVLETHNARSTQ